MREIKFRVWLKEGLGTRMLYNPYLGRALAEQIFSKYWMQFSGLKDKNGQDIYEGDILKCDCHDPTRRVMHDEFVAVLFMNGMFMWADSRGHSDQLYGWNDLMEVRGNVWQNPELLNEQD